MNLMDKVVSLCKRRGFVFQSSEIYGGLKSFYDYGPLGVELKRNISQLWWLAMVDYHDDVVGLDSSVIMHPDVWKASGHIEHFTDPLVDCKNCQHRFRADKQPQIPVGQKVTWKDRSNMIVHGVVGECGYVCPECGSSHLSEPREFSGLFPTSVGTMDPCAGQYSDPSQLPEVIRQHSAYLRPEVAQGMFVQFLNVQKTMSMKVPFGIAQIGKSFRNEILAEHFIFRNCEFKQMAMEYFCEPESQEKWLDYWCGYRMEWYKALACHYDHFRLRAHKSHELAHYSDRGFDVEYQYPWGWDELEGIASRGDYDLKCHSQASGAKLQYFDPKKTDPSTGKMGWKYTPHVIEPVVGLNRAFLCFLLDAYTEEYDEDGKVSRVYLDLHPKLAPYTVAVLPLIEHEILLGYAEAVARECRRQEIKVVIDTQQSIGERYAKHDEIGTPYVVTVDRETPIDGEVILHYRNTKKQFRLKPREIIWMLEGVCKLPFMVTKREDYDL